MFRKLVAGLMLPLLLFLSKSSGDSASRNQNAPDGFNPGPDIIAGNMNDLDVYGTTGTQRGLAIGVTSCNAGNQFVGFFAMPNTDHPAIAQNLYRMSGGANGDDRFEQIGQSWVKHTYGAKQANSCSFGCQPGGDFTHLGVGCSDTYFADQSAVQSDLGSRAWINPFTGVFPNTARNHTGHNHTAVSHMVLTENADLNPAMNPGARFYAELLYVTPNEYSWCQTHPGECNMYNNASYRQYNVTGTTSYVFTPAAATVRMTPAIAAWAGATINPIEPEPGVDGRAFIAFKVSNPSAGVWHYEYAIYNQNLDRAIQSFSVPLGCGATVTNLGFHAPLNHPGFPNDGTLGDLGFSNAPWTTNQTGDAVSWSAETIAVNQNANAIRWGTLYNFRFDSDHPPIPTNATIGYFKTGTPTMVSILGPNVCDLPTPTPGPTASPTGTPTATPSVTPSATPCAGVILEENFDAVTPPALPPGWVSGPGCWVTSNVDPDTPPNDAFCPDINGLSDCSLEVSVTVPSGVTILSFRNNFDTEYSNGVYWDGGVLEVSSPNISGGEFLDITDSHVGGSILEGGYTGEISGNAGNPLAGRFAWSGSSNGYINTVINLGPNLSGQFVHFRWRFCSDKQVGAPGWRIDTVQLSDGTCAPTPTPTPALTTVQVGMGGTSFMPQVVSIQPGETVQWIWASSNHSVTSGTPGNPDGIFESNVQNVPFMFSHTFETVGTFPYYCRVHGSMMTGTVNVLSSSPTPTVTPSATPTPTSPPIGQSINLSTRLRIEPGNSAGIGGFIITGPDSMRVLIRGIGPSLGAFGIPDPLPDPTLALYDSSGVQIQFTDNWRDTQEADIIATGLPPTNDLESAILATLTPGAYTAILSGNGVASGVALLEIYDLDPPGNGTRLGNISTRGHVGTGSDVVIGGFIIVLSGNDTVALRGIGPSLSEFGISDPLADPVLELRDSNGALLKSNDNWEDDSAGHKLLLSLGLGLSDPLEAGIVQTLTPGAYTAVLAGVQGGTGIGLVEVYDNPAGLPTPTPTPTSAPNPRPNR